MLREGVSRVDRVGRDGDVPMMNIDPDAACSKTEHTASVVRRRSTRFLNRSSHPTPELDSFSRSIAA